jgi:hypothetical protein
MRTVMTRGLTTNQRALQMACSAVAIVSFSVVSTSSAGPARQVAGLCLIAAFTCAVWFLHRRRFDAIVPAVGLTLVFLILAGLGLAAVHALSTVPVALVLAVATLAAAWAGAGALPPAPGSAERRARLRPPNPLAAIGVVCFAAAAVLAVRYSAASATADTDAASSVALWAYPSGDQLRVGVQQPAGHGATSLRIVVTQAGATVATWNNIHLAAGQTWEAPALTITGPAPAQVVALDGTTIVASLSSR